MDISDFPDFGRVGSGALVAVPVTLGVLWVPAFRMLVLRSLVVVIGGVLIVEGPEGAVLWLRHFLAEAQGAGSFLAGVALGSLAAILASWWLAPKRTPESSVPLGGFLRQAVSAMKPFLLLLLISAGYVQMIKADLPSGPELRRFFDTPTLILFTDGSGQRERDCICYYPLRAIDLPEGFRSVLTASEDRRFDLHSGVDWVALVRATLAQLQGSRQGGSTISQQISKSIVGSRRDVFRKIPELVLAWRIEQVFSKDEIFLFYLNRSYYGRGAWGLGQAARTYFGKRARDLNTYEMAALVGMLPNPERNSKRPDLAAERVLGRMVAAGKLSPGEAKRAIRQGSRPGTLPRFDFDERYYLDAAEEAAAQMLPATRAGTWRISLGLNTVAQMKAREIVRQVPHPVGTEVALVAIDRQGRVEALIGGRDYARSQFNRATQARRQPASTVKPFTYLAALATGMAPNTPLDDIPVSIGPWSPENHDKRFLGRLNLTEALAQSRNAATVRLAEKLGFENVQGVFHRFGLPGTPGTPAFVLGTDETRVIDIAGSYASLAAGGLRVRPAILTLILDADGKPTAVPPLGPAERISDAAAVRTLARMLRHAAEFVTPGAGFPGKSGTSQNGMDAWFAGWSDRVTLAVWVGRDDSRPVPGLWGRGPSARIWSAYLNWTPPGE